MNNRISVLLIILALSVGILAGYYYAILINSIIPKVDQDSDGLSNEALNQINPFSENNLKTNPYEYVNPFE